MQDIRFSWLELHKLYEMGVSHPDWLRLYVDGLSLLDDAVILLGHDPEHPSFLDFEFFLGFYRLRITEAPPLLKEKFEINFTSAVFLSHQYAAAVRHSISEGSESVAELTGSVERFRNDLLQHYLSLRVLRRDLMRSERGGSDTN